MHEGSRRRDPRLSPDAGSLLAIATLQRIALCSTRSASWVIIFVKAEKEGQPTGRDRDLHGAHP